MHSKHTHHIKKKNIVTNTEPRNTPNIQRTITKHKTLNMLIYVNVHTYTETTATLLLTYANHINITHMSTQRQNKNIAKQQYTNTHTHIIQHNNTTSTHTTNNQTTQHKINIDKTKQNGCPQKTKSKHRFDTIQHINAYQTNWTKKHSLKDKTDAYNKTNRHNTH